MASKTLNKTKTAAGGRKTTVAVSTPSVGTIRSISQTVPPTGRWTFLTNHSHVLILLSRNPSMVLREVAALVGITERAVQRIIADLEEEGFIEREKVGRQNHYRILGEQPLRHPIESHRTVNDLIRCIGDAS